MRRILNLFTGLLLVGCAPAPIMKTPTPLDNGHTVSVTVGQVLIVELPSNRTTGYGWTERTPSESVLERVGEPAYRRDASSSARVGAGGTEVWRFRAAKVGRQTLHLQYARPWETNVAPAKVVTCGIVVTGK